MIHTNLETREAYIKRVGVQQVTAEVIAEALGWSAGHRVLAVIEANPIQGVFDVIIEGPNMPIKEEGAAAQVVQPPRPDITEGAI